MADPIMMKSKQFVTGHVDAFVDADGNPQAVDAARWELSDPALGMLSQSADGTDVRFESADMPMDAPAMSGVLSLHVTEAGVVDAFVLPFDVMISSHSSPNAVGANITFSAPQDLP